MGEVAFVAKQPLFAMQPACIPRQAAIAANHAVAGDHDRNGVAPIGGAHGADGFFVAKSMGLVHVGARLPKGDFLEKLPHFLLEFGSSGIEVEVKYLACPLKIGLQLLNGFSHARIHQRIRARIGFAENDRRNAGSRTNDFHPSDGGKEGGFGGWEISHALKLRIWEFW